MQGDSGIINRPRYVCLRGWVCCYRSSPGCCCCWKGIAFSSIHGEHTVAESMCSKNPRQEQTAWKLKCSLSWDHGWCFQIEVLKLFSPLFFSVLPHIFKHVHWQWVGCPASYNCDFPSACLISLALRGMIMW